MTTYQTFNIEGHTLATLQLNPDAMGKPVILLHGITGNIAAWQFNPLRFILEQGPRISLSLPGHYPAAFPPGFHREQLTVEMLARVMAKAIRRMVEERPVTLIGRSTGGFAALNIAVQYPEMVSRIVSISGFARGRWIGFLGFQQRLVRMGKMGRTLFKAFYRLVGASPGAFRSVLRLRANGSNVIHVGPSLEQVIELNLVNYRNLDLDAMALYFLAMPEIDISSLLPQIRVPTLVIAGDRDQIVPPDESHKIASLVPNAELALIPGARHLSFFESPPEYQARLSSWLQKTR
jgi:pimeloyl-ACP methyl ester carboxylesterase